VPYTGIRARAKEFLGRLREFAKLGITHYHGAVPDVASITPLDVVGRPDHPCSGRTVTRTLRAVLPRWGRLPDRPHQGVQRAGRRGPARN